MSGIATYTSRLCAELRHLCDVTVFVGADPTEVEAPSGVTVENVARFDTLNAEQTFDASLFFIGNSHFHVAMFDVLRSQRGTVLLHDIRLTGLYQQLQHYAPHQLNGGSVGATLRHFYPDCYDAEIEQLPFIPAEVANTHQVFMAREVAALADRVLVHSSHAAELLRRDAAIEASLAYPLPCPSPSATIGHAPFPNSSAGVPILASFGIVDPIKQPERLIEALPLVRHCLPMARLRFVGAVDDGYRDQLRALATSFGVGDHVEFAGHLDRAKFTEAQRNATVALQLRAFSNGESSACVSELLALGIPTLVSAIGAMNELPNNVVAKVDDSVCRRELADLICALVVDDRQRDALASNARCFADANSFRTAASRLNELLFS